MRKINNRPKNWIQEMSWYEHLYYSLKHAREWHCGFDFEMSKYFGFCTMYYDGWHWGFRVLGFYIGASYY